LGTRLGFIWPSECRTRTNRIERNPMKKPDRKKQRKALAKGKKKAAKELLKKRQRKLKRQARLAENIEERKMKKQTFELEDEVRRIQNKGLTIRKNKEQPIDE